MEAMAEGHNTYEAELVQVAAVAIAALTDHYHGVANLDGGAIPILIKRRIEQERRRQADLWEPIHNEKLRWLAILTEEVGEVAEAILEGR